MDLATLKVGVTACIKEIAGMDSLAHQLQEIGFTPGSEVAVVSRSLFDGPMAVSLRGARIALRPNEARRIRL